MQKEVPMIFNIILYGLLIFMIFRTISLSKRSKKSKQLIEALQYADDANQFFPKIDEAIASQEDIEYQTKAKILKLWGMAYHNQVEDFKPLLDEISLDALFKQERGITSIQMNEDSFFYLLLAIPNLLQAKDNMELIDVINEKVQPYQDVLQNQIVYALSQECNKFYKHEDDCGETFYNKLLDGDYGEYSYSKNMIGLYKAIASANLAKLYEETNPEKYQEQMDMVETFNQMSVGARWIQCIGLELKEEEVVEEEKPSIDDYRRQDPIEQDEQKEKREVNLDDYRPAPPIQKEKSEE